MIKVTILAGKTFQHVKYFEDTNFDVSEEYANYLIREGIARIAPTPGAQHLSDPNSYKGAKGPDRF